MKLPLFAAAALLATVGAASAQWGPPPPGMMPPPPPPGYGYRPAPPPGYGPPPGAYRERGWEHRRRCFWRETPWGPRRVCRGGPPRW